MPERCRSFSNDGVTRTYQLRASCTSSELGAVVKLRFTGARRRWGMIAVHAFLRLLYLIMVWVFRLAGSARPEQRLE
jgi:hypothetical protein